MCLWLHFRLLKARGLTKKTGLDKLVNVGLKKPAKNWRGKRSRRTIITLISSEEPPLKNGESEKQKFLGTVWLEKIITPQRRAKIKNQLNKGKQFLAFGSKLVEKDALAKATLSVADRVKYAKNFIVEQRLVPHFIILTLGLVVALCNVIVARGAENLYDLIPADPSSQVSVTASINRYTPLIPNSAAAVEKLVTSSTDPTSGVFALDVKTTATQITEQPQAPAESQGPRTKNLMYTVQAGDTLTGLGMKYNVKVSSIKFANDITNIDLIKPGVTIKIPPEGWEPSAKEIAAKSKTLIKTAKTTSSKGITLRAGAGSKYNSYPYGYCTYYAATRRAIPSNWGNAGQWLNSAKRAGYSTGGEPVAGAIVVTRESWWGHVGYVESVSGGSFTILEMNYNGWGVVNSRTISANDGAIKGFVY